MIYEIENPYPPYQSEIATTAEEARKIAEDFERDIHARGRKAIVRQVANGGHRQ